MCFAIRMVTYERSNVCLCEILYRERVNALHSLCVLCVLCVRFFYRTVSIALWQTKKGYNICELCVPSYGGITKVIYQILYVV